ncbi:hypothetical protein PR202_ga27407 [Eleusine coracana subsp. coracana]|uniref:Enoyl reductase (ER) domain-containing protein n=1 Tax=Eleusine coracana subsp. coracana TaxID=191504 RepID=A0AAV5DEI5_ELECO|nr:hypothetical protein PR202_ga27407 [Eleusine coracana subsp. coracana]
MSHVSIWLAVVDTNLQFRKVPPGKMLATTGAFVHFQQQRRWPRGPSSSSRLRIPSTDDAFRCCCCSSSSTPISQGSNKEETFFCSKEMVKAIRIHELGGPEVMKWEEVQVGEPKEGEIRIRTTAIGVNFIDIYFRKGVYSAPALPFTPGMEAVGVVTAVGPGLTGRKVGDVVAYAGNPMGSYAEEQILPARVAVPVLPSIDHKVAASVMLKGMTAHVLVRRAFKVQRGHTVLVHAAAGGVGSLLGQWANALGATVIGTVSNEEKAAQATQDGCHHASVECLASRGFLVSFGQSSGIPDPIPLSDLASKSLFLTRPSMMHYTATREELLESAGEVFANVVSGVLRVRVNHTYPLSEAGRAHADLESRKTSGSIVLIPDS